MQPRFDQNHTFHLLIVALAAWIVPGGGHLLLNERKRAVVIFATITLTFLAGLYIGSVGVVDPVEANLWYIAQVLNTPLVAAIGYVTRAGGYPVYGKPNEIGQIYTSIAGLLNLLCIINAVYIARSRYIESFEK
jgi:hypothetical protein